jgi:hypothetical protein
MSFLKKPENIPADVWNAYTKWAEFKGPHQERLVYWDRFLDIQKRYQIHDGKWSLNINTIQTSLF